MKSIFRALLFFLTISCGDIKNYNINESVFNTTVKVEVRGKVWDIVQDVKSFINECIKNGIYFAPSKFEAGFISTKHTNKEINNTISVIKEILNKGI